MYIALIKIDNLVYTKMSGQMKSFNSLRPMEMLLGSTVKSLSAI